MFNFLSLATESKRGHKKWHVSPVFEDLRRLPRSGTCSSTHYLTSQSLSHCFYLFVLYHYHYFPAWHTHLASPSQNGNVTISIFIYSLQLPQGPPSPHCPTCMTPTMGSQPDHLPWMFTHSHRAKQMCATTWNMAVIFQHLLCAASWRTRWR